MGDEFHCVQLGTWTNNNFKVAFILPGTKVRGDETPDEAMQRYFDEKLASLCGTVRITSQSVIVEQKHSPSYGMDTKYIKRCYHATTHDSYTDDNIGRSRENAAYSNWDIFAVTSSDNAVTLYAWMPAFQFQHCLEDVDKPSSNLATWL